jgi:hypothetical protein
MLTVQDRFQIPKQTLSLIELYPAQLGASTATKESDEKQWWQSLIASWW